MQTTFDAIVQGCPSSAPPGHAGNVELVQGQYQSLPFHSQCGVSQDVDEFDELELHAAMTAAVTIAVGIDHREIPTLRV
jgi:hypothetical protein